MRIDQTAEQIAQGWAEGAGSVSGQAGPTALLVGSPQGSTDYIHADLREPDEILQEAARTLNFSEPIAITLFGILGHITDNDVAYTIVHRLLDALSSGSYLVISDLTNVVNGEVVDSAIQIWNSKSSNPRVNRNPRGDRPILRRPGTPGARRGL